LPPIKRDRDYWNTTGYCGEEVVKCYLYMNSATTTRSPYGGSLQASNQRRNTKKWTFSAFLIRCDSKQRTISDLSIFLML
jgi:hypothetical protein